MGTRRSSEGFSIVDAVECGFACIVSVMSLNTYFSNQKLLESMNQQQDTIDRRFEHVAELQQYDLTLTDQLLKKPYVKRVETEVNEYNDYYLTCEGGFLAITECSAPSN